MIRQKSYDIVIVGGGFVGSAALCGLQCLNRDLKIALVDAVPAKKKSADGRSIVLSYASKTILERWKVWGKLADRSESIKAVHISQENHFGRTQILAKEMGVPALGYVVAAHDLGEALKESFSNVDCFYEATCNDLKKVGEGIQLNIQKDNKEEVFLAKLVLAADGANSSLREMAELPVKQFQYSKKALVTEVSVQHPNQTGYERFLNQGVLAMVPRISGKYGVIWKDEPKEIERLLALEDEAFLSALSSCMGYRLGRFSDLGKRHVYPLSFARALKETAPCLVLLGDAAHANPPVGAQGLNLSLRDIDLLLALIDEMEEFDFSDHCLLERYEALRLKDQAKVVTLVNFPMTSIFKKIPDSVKGLGWLGLDLCSGLHKGFAKSMMGE